MNKWRSLAVISVMALLLWPLTGEARRTRERAKYKVKSALYLKGTHVISHGALRKVTHMAGIGSDHEEALHIYNACMEGENPLAEAVAFFKADRMSAQVPLGNPERLGHELCAIDALQLKRYVTVHDVQGAPPAELVPINHPWIGISPGVPQERAVASPWVRDYAENLAVRLHQDFVHEGSEAPERSFVTSSLVRPVAIQRVQWNSPARCINESSLCSSHTTGSTFDITRKNLTGKQESFLVKQLQEDRKRGKILFILEPRGNHYHIFVFPPALALLVGPLEA